MPGLWYAQHLEGSFLCSHLAGMQGPFWKSLGSRTCSLFAWKMGLDGGNQGTIRENQCSYDGWNHSQENAACLEIPRDLYLYFTKLSEQHTSVCGRTNRVVWVLRVSVNKWPVSLYRAGCPGVSNSLSSHWLYPLRLLHPWDFPGTSTGPECHFLLQIFPTQGSKQRLLCLCHWREDYLPLRHLGSPACSEYSHISCEVHLCLCNVFSFLLPVFRTRSGILWHQMQIVLIIRDRS